MNRKFNLTKSIVASSMILSPAIADWQVTLLSPSGSAFSEVMGGFDGQQVGYAWYLPDTAAHASLWNGTAESWIDLAPAGATLHNLAGRVVRPDRCRSSISPMRR